MNLGRYRLHAKIANGGMGSVSLGVLRGAANFSRVVAIKRLHPQLATDPHFIAMFLDEAHLAARVRHPNVVPTLDVVNEDGETFLVMEYVDGESLAGMLAALQNRGERMDLGVVSAIVVGMLRGLHAAHTATAAGGEHLAIVHRDVSPQNVLVGTDGVPRLVDFGIAHAAVRLQSTREGQFKGKLAYSAPELLVDGKASVASDVFAAGVVLWELVSGRRAYNPNSEAQLFALVAMGKIPSLESVAPWAPPELVAALEPSLHRDPEARHPSALAMAEAIERAVPPASAATVGALVELLAGDALAARRNDVRAAEAAPMENESVAHGISASVEVASSAAPGNAVASPSTEVANASNAANGAHETKETRSPRQWPIVVGGALLALALVGALVIRGAAKTSVEASAGDAPSASPSSWTSAARPASVEGPTPSTSVASAASASASASASAGSDKPPTRRVLHPSTKRDTATSPSVSLHKHDPCDPPYTFDENGIKRVKRECFGRH